MSRIILVGGGSSSGKTYVTSKVIENIGTENVTRITIDDYYKDQSGMPLEERKKTNYDHPKAFDWPLIREHIKQLKEGKTIRKPKYDFVEHNRVQGEYETVTPNKIVVVEGIMALVDRKLRDYGDLKVFVYASRERRFLRRVIRDREERGRDFENIVDQYFDSVQPMFEEIIEPSSAYADVILNNDGKKNIAIDVLTCLFQKELEIAESGEENNPSTEPEFEEEILRNAFSAR